MLKRHATESKRTASFLKYALGKRDQKPGYRPSALKTSDSIYSSAKKDSLPNFMNNKSCSTQEASLVEQSELKSGRESEFKTKHVICLIQEPKK